MLDKFTSADFAPLLNQAFRIFSEGMEPVTAVLIDISELGRAPEEGDIISRRAFSPRSLSDMKHRARPSSVDRTISQTLQKLLGLVIG